MENRFNFDIVFASDYENETVIGNWNFFERNGYRYCQTSADGMSYQILFYNDGYIYIKAYNDTDHPISGFVGVRFPWNYGAESYTLIPGIFYNGNQFDFTHVIPMINKERRIFEASWSTATFPVMLTKDSSKGVCYEISPMSFAGYNGVRLNADAKNATFYAPAMEKEIYRFRHFRGSRTPFTWQPEELITIRIKITEFDCPDVLSLFDHYWNHAIRSDIYPAYNTPKISENEGAEIVRDWFYKKHCVITPKDEPLILNAFLDLYGEWPYSDTAEWNIMIGWCSGSMSALPLLKFGGKYRDFAVKFLDFLSTHGNSQSGVKYCVYDGEEWMTKKHRQYHDGYTHCRFYSDYLTYLGKAIRFEREHGYSHPDWEEDFARGVGIICGVWEREHDFGMYWETDCDEPYITRSGSCAGAFCLLTLAEALVHDPENGRIRRCFDEACREYYSRCVVTGRSNGGPIDIKEADDSESIAALSDALMKYYTIFGGEEKLKMASDAAKIFATWVLSYNHPFPGGTMLETLNLCGGVIANIQNRHIGPGICTNSARFLYDLGKATGDSRWTDLYYLVKTAAINCITRYNGEFFDKNLHGQFAAGMLSENIAMSDSMTSPGETWCVSASWPATAVLLGWFDSPEE